MLSMSEGDRVGEGGGSPGKQGSSIVKITECQQALSVPLKLQKLTFLEKRGSIVGRKKTHSDCCCLVAAVQMKLHMFPLNTAAPQDLVLLPFLWQLNQTRPIGCGLTQHLWKCQELLVFIFLKWLEITWGASEEDRGKYVLTSVNVKNDSSVLSASLLSNTWQACHSI